MKINEYNIENAMAPLWIMYPEISRGSIGWRMGYGEDYIYKFHDWYSSLNENEKSEYQNFFPEPIGWLGWYNDEFEDQYDEEGNLICAQGDIGKEGYSLERIKQFHNRGKKMKYLFFWGHTPAKNSMVSKACFSQWWKCKFIVDGDVYYSVEQYMMAEKARLFGDDEVLEKILDSRNPKEVKALGRKVRNFDEEAWKKARYSIVIRGNYHKFIQNRELKEYLIGTGNRVLVEASPYDKIWGIGMLESEENIENPFKWKGINLLGFALMEVRAEIARVCMNEAMVKVEG